MCKAGRSTWWRKSPGWRFGSQVNVSSQQAKGTFCLPGSKKNDNIRRVGSRGRFDLPVIENKYKIGDNMPRTAREKSQTGIYHIMLRGIDKRDLFLKESEYEKFIDYIQKARDKSEFTVYAYCLMTNHIHILLKTQTEAQDIGDIVRRITVGYAQYHNVQNGRTGHLFQNRFRSEVVESDVYFLEVIRYIHQNPLKAGMVNNIEDYKWSSYNAYFNTENILVETSFALGLFRDTKHFETFMKQKNNDQCLEYNPKTRYSDEDLKEFVSSFVDINTLNELDTRSRDKALANIKEVTTSSNRQLSRVLNIGRGIIEKVTQR